GSRRNLEELVAFCKEHRRDGRPLIEDAIIRNKLAEIAVNLNVARVLSFRVAAMQQAGKIPNQEASMANLFNSESSQRRALTGQATPGLYGPLSRSSRWAPLAGRFANGVLSPCSTVAGGSSEIQRNIIAQRGLGLPR